MTAVSRWLCILIYYNLHCRLALPVHPSNLASNSYNPSVNPCSSHPSIISSSILLGVTNRRWGDDPHNLWNSWHWPTVGLASNKTIVCKIKMKTAVKDTNKIVWGSLGSLIIGWQNNEDAVGSQALLNGCSLLVRFYNQLMRFWDRFIQSLWNESQKESSADRNLQAPGGGRQQGFTVTQGYPAPPAKVRRTVWDICRFFHWSVCIFSMDASVATTTTTTSSCNVWTVFTMYCMTRSLSLLPPSPSFLFLRPSRDRCRQSVTRSKVSFLTYGLCWKDDAGNRLSSGYWKVLEWL